MQGLCAELTHRHSINGNFLSCRGQASSWGESWQGKPSAITAQGSRLPLPLHRGPWRPQSSRDIHLPCVASDKVTGVLAETKQCVVSPCAERVFWRAGSRDWECTVSKTAGLMPQCHGHTTVMCPDSCFLHRLREGT